MVVTTKYSQSHEDTIFPSTPAWKLKNVVLNKVYLRSQYRAQKLGPILLEIRPNPPAIIRAHGVQGREDSGMYNLQR